MNQELQEIMHKSSISKVLLQGGNSVVTKVEHNSKNYCVKNYSQSSDSQKRLLKEYSSLLKLDHFDTTLFAKPIGYSLQDSTAIYTWLNGVRPVLDKFAVDLMIMLIRELNIISLTLKRESFDLATDFVITDADASTQIESRFSNLVLSSEVETKSLLEELEFSKNFLLNNFNLGSAPMLTLSVSDLGPHNLLWDSKENCLHCVDLEFFGWDDIHKLIVDTLLHPQIQWNLELANYFVKQIETTFTFSLDRLFQMWKFSSLKWAMIIMNRISRNQALLGRPLDLNPTFNQARTYILQSRENIKSVEDMIKLSVLATRSNQK
jgi:hypothetical protein